MMNEILNDVIGNFIILGMIIAYGFQFVKIIRARSSDGISHLFLVIGYISSLCSLANAILFYYPEMTAICDGVLSCDSNMLGFLQLLVQSSLYMIFYVLYMIYYDPSNGSSIVCCRRQCGPMSRIGIISVYVVLTGLLSAPIVASVLLAMNDDIVTNSSDMSDSNSGATPMPLLYIKRYAYVLSIITIITACIQYVPQIIQTWRDKYPGSLSLITIAIQCPGSFVIAVFLALQNAGNLSTWLPFAITGLLQMILLIMGTVFYHRKKLIMNPRYQPLIINN